MLRFPCLTLLVLRKCLSFVRTCCFPRPGPIGLAWLRISAQPYLNSSGKPREAVAESKNFIEKFSRVITHLPLAYLLFIQLQALGPDGVFPGQSAGDSEIVLSSGGHGGYFRDTGF
jgi:hypothetical protein